MLAVNQSGERREIGALDQPEYSNTSSIAFEGDSQAEMYPGNWSDYETMIKKKFGKDLIPHA